MKKTIKYILIVLLVAVVVMQFIKPDKNLGGLESIANFKADTNASEEVLSIFKTHCFDCHSNQTKYPWYAEIAPVSYWLAAHVDEGKDEFNMSNWNSYSVKKKDHKLKEIIDVLEEDEMPLFSYTLIHGDISEKDKELIIDWASVKRLQYLNQLKVSSK